VDQGLQPERAHRRAAVLQRRDLELADRQRAAGPLHARARHEPLTIGGGHQVDLVLDGEDRAVGREQRERGVARGGVRDHRGHAAVDEAVLLGEVGTEGQLDHDTPGLDRLELRPDQLHRGLAREARAHAGLEIGVDGVELHR
jgi:hypothetical protein